MRDNKKLYYCFLCLIFIVGIAIRTFALGCTEGFEDDECRLLLAVADKSFLEMFLPIGLAQSAPPFYLILLKSLYLISNGNEFIMHALPYVFSVGSMFFFYKISRIFFCKKYIILLSNLLFGINCSAVLYSSIIKQYSSDIFVGLVLIFYLHNLDISKLSLKNLIILSAILTFLPFISLPSLFFIGAFLIVNIIHNYKNKTFYRKLFITILFPAIIWTLYYFYNLAPSKVDLDTTFPEYWNGGFINSAIDIIKIFVVNFKFIFNPNNFTLFHFILYFIGIFYCLKKRTPLSIFMILTLIFCLLGAGLGLYPFIGRINLYSIPMFILLVLAPLDICNNKKLLSFFILIFIFGFYKYNHIYFSQILLNQAHYNKFHSKMLVKELCKQFNPQTDKIIINPASVALFSYYSAKFNLINPQIIIVQEYNTETSEISQNEKITTENINIAFKTMTKNARYFVCLYKDYSKSPIFQKIYDAIKISNSKVISELHHNGGIMLLIQKK